jgi:hypothetical protein
VCSLLLLVPYWLLATTLFAHRKIAKRTYRYAE